MSAPSHTPGPWSAIKGTRGNPWWTVIALDGRDVGDVAVEVNVWNNPKKLAQVEANARLIAAAPDLLAALFGLLHTCELNTDDMEPETREAIKAAATAIAKAKGTPPA